jgi:hypothetical protein
MTKPSWLKDAIATPRGYVSKSGELLKRQSLTPEQIAEFNGDTQPAREMRAPMPEPDPAVLTEEEVEDLVEEAEEMAEEEIDISSMTKAELVELAESIGMDPTGMTKSELLEVLA